MSQKPVVGIPFDEHAAEMIARVVGSELGERSDGAGGRAQCQIGEP